MADELSLKDALGLFQTGLRDFALSKALSDANERVQQIKMSGIKDTEKRLALGQIAQDLVSRMGQAGATAADVQQARLNYAPKQYASADAAILDARLSGDTAALKTAEEAALAQKKDEVATLKTKAEIQADVQARQANKEFELQRRKFEHEERKKQTVTQKASDVEFMTNTQVAMKHATELEELVKKYGNFELKNPEAATQLESAAYQLAINYAKIVDPASVAREGEVAAAQKYLLPMGATTRNSKTLASIKRYKQTIKDYVKARATSRGESAPKASTETDLGKPKWASFIKE